MPTLTSTSTASAPVPHEHFQGLAPDQLLRAARHVADLSQRELAAAAGIDQAVIARIESGETASPRLITLCRLLTACGCRLSAVDGSGKALWPQLYDDARDKGGRRWPAHLTIERLVVTSWWRLTWLPAGPLPEYTASWRRLYGPVARAAEQLSRVARDEPPPAEQ